MDTNNQPPQPNQKQGYNKVLLGIIALLTVVAVVLATLLVVGLAKNSGTEPGQTNNNSSNQSGNQQPAEQNFDFDACIKRNTKPGEDAHIANDKCINEKAQAQGSGSPSNGDQQQGNKQQ